ncbi:MAG: hypothetical protein LBL51_01000 [Synergistaceae bacterium]|jgi:hypothetical protein|nr:hypothetical protein [Synergistaceae bacterium]
MTLVEGIILIVIATITLTAIFQTVAWGSRFYTWFKGDIDGRALMASWSQTFEAVYPSVDRDPDGAFAEVAALMGGTWAGGSGEIGGYRVSAASEGVTDGALALTLSVEKDGWTASGRRHYNDISSAMVPDSIASRDAS